MQLSWKETHLFSFLTNLTMAQIVRAVADSVFLGILCLRVWEYLKETTRLVEKRYTQCGDYWPYHKPYLTWLANRRLPENLSAEQTGLRHMENTPERSRIAKDEISGHLKARERGLWWNKCQQLGACRCLECSKNVLTSPRIILLRMSFRCEVLISG